MARTAGRCPGQLMSINSEFDIEFGPHEPREELPIISVTTMNIEKDGRPIGYQVFVCKHCATLYWTHEEA